MSNFTTVEQKSYKISSAQFQRLIYRALNTCAVRDCAPGAQAVLDVMLLQIYLLSRFHRRLCLGLLGFSLVLALGLVDFYGGLIDEGVGIRTTLDRTTEVLQAGLGFADVSV